MCCKIIVTETSQRSMLANTARELSTQCGILPLLGTLPLHMHVDDSHTTPGAISACTVHADTVGVPQSLSSSLHIIHIS